MIWLSLGRLGFDIDTTNIPSVKIPPYELLREEKIGGAEVIVITNEEQASRICPRTV